MQAPDYLLQSVKDALSYQANTFMFYTGAPQNTKRKPVSELKVKEAQAWDIVTIAWIADIFVWETIAENVKMGLLARAREGRWNGGVVLGYTLKPNLKISLQVCL